MSVANNQKKADQLGMPYGTANGRLRKSILWQYVVKCRDNFCHQCGAEILSESDLSIEHKIPWLDSDNPVEKFFNLDNIAYSHLSCNIGAARRYEASEEVKKLKTSISNKNYYAKLDRDYRKANRRRRYLEYGT